jgi:hypothetical protein
MPDYYVPKTKKDLVTLIRRQYWCNGQTVSGLERKPIKQLYAIYHSIRQRADANQERKNKNDETTLCSIC